LAEPFETVSSARPITLLTERVIQPANSSHLFPFIFGLYGKLEKRMNSEISEMLQRIRLQIATLEEAASVLQRLDDLDALHAVSKPRKGGKKAVKRSALSPEARDRIAAAQRKRWAAVKKATKKRA
jgi:hypothetical protein